MKRSLIPHPATRRRRGFTIVELLAASTIAIVVSGALYGIVQAGMTVGVRSLAINHTGQASRSALDRAEQVLQLAYTEPTPLQKNGQKQTDATAPAAGVRFYRYIGGPYQVDIPSSGLSGTADTLTIFARTESTSNRNAPAPPPAPRINDILVINTTILMSGRSSQIYAQVKSVSAGVTTTRRNSSNDEVSGIRYTLGLTQTLTDNEGSIPASTPTVTATLVRPVALLVVPKDDNRELRLYEGFPDTTNINLSLPHQVITNQIAWHPNSSGPTANDAFATPFRIRKIGDRTFINSNIHVRANRYDNHLRSAEHRNEFSAFVELRSRVPVKCIPNE